MSAITLSGSSTTVATATVTSYGLNDLILNSEFSYLNGNLIKSSIMMKIGLSGTAVEESTALLTIQTALALNGDSVTVEAIQASIWNAISLSGSTTTKFVIGQSVVVIEHDYASWVAVKAIYSTDYMAKAIYSTDYMVKGVIE